MSLRISDIRPLSDFRSKSFSNYKMSEVRKELLQAIHAGKIEQACYWSAEMVCSGHVAVIWDVLIGYMARYIHLANPKLAIYLDMRYNVFRNIAAPIANELELRNNEKIRKLFAEVVCSVTLSNKRPGFEAMKIDRASEFDMTRLSERLKAPSLEFAAALFKPKDPKELFVAVNEFAYHVQESRDLSRACYWVEWGIEFEHICKARREPCVCEKRLHLPIERKFAKDVIWLFWDALLAASCLHPPLVEKAMSSLLRLFCVRYTTAACKRRRYLMYYAVSLLTEPVTASMEMVPDRVVLETAVNQIDRVYSQIKKNEVSGNQEYLFHNLSSQEYSTERVMQQLEILNQLDTFGERMQETDINTAVL